MAELIPPPDLAPISLESLTPDQCIDIWIDLIDTTDALLLAGLRHELGARDDLREAYNRWSVRHRLEHDRANQRMMDKLRLFEN